MLLLYLLASGRSSTIISADLFAIHFALEVQITKEYLLWRLELA
jgi:hypothetical protein